MRGRCHGRHRTGEAGRARPAGSVLVGGVGGCGGGGGVSFCVFCFWVWGGGGALASVSLFPVCPYRIVCVN